ncbi:hypothetical protein [Halalkalibacter okhensis]|uniref:Uncharacterized protein n=1 Tax=Halalkalibacter okhensis TaxID=333138 RepID=A0A0B0IM37_9BACI|nr:hypothetical protein [Halalkalibacter okhensis]KHF40731.1 hypothetical protein LQ50_08080 [Halalkalibacter okhensis]
MQSITKERHYKVTVDVTSLGATLILNVYAPINEDVNEEKLRQLSIKRGIEFYEELGVSVQAESLKPIGFRDCGVFQ